jgi:Zn-dependent protease with chaperone function
VTTATPAEYRPIPGPVDRESFDHAQRRYRRASWRWTFAVAVAVAIMGVPLSAAISPLILAVATIVVDLAGKIVPAPDLLAPFRDLFNDQPVTNVVGLVVAVTVALLVPGAVVLTLSWIRVRRLFREAGTAAELDALGARLPRPGDLEEHQLANVAAEIALAAGLPPPEVRVIDSPVANAAVVGRGPTDAVVVVSRGLLDGLSRDQTQGVVAHLVARAGNGDLGIARTMSGLYYTLGFVSAVLTAPTERKGRRAAGPVLRLMLRPGAARKHPERAAAASAALLDAQGGGGDAESIEHNGLVSMLLLPVLAAQMAFVMNQLILSSFVITPMLKRAWRARAELADASAVELTRYPDGLASALVQLSTIGGEIPGTQALAHLFVVGSTGGSRTTGSGDSPLRGFQTRPDRRLKQLTALGSTVPYTPRKRMGPLAKLLVVVIGGPFIILLYAIMLGICVALMGIAFMLYMMFLVGPVFFLHAVLRGNGYLS